MFGLYGLALYVAIALIGLAVSALLALFAVVVGLITHPLRTLALILGKVAAIAAGLALVLALLTWFAYDHTKPDFLPVFAGSIAVIVGGVIIYGFCEWFLERPTRAERRAMQEYEAQSMYYAPHPVEPSQVPADGHAQIQHTRDGVEMTVQVPRELAQALAKAQNANDTK